MTAFKIEVPVSDENENWLNAVRRQRGTTTAPTEDPSAPLPEAPANVDETGDGEGAVSTDEEETIAEAVAAYRAGEIPFDEALKRVAETSLTWQEAQVLLADEDGAPPPAEPASDAPTEEQPT